MGGADAEIGEGGFVPIDWSDVATEVKQALCGLAQASEVLDGVLLYGSDGDGVDEVMNILTAASVFLGGGGLVALAARGVLSNGAILGTIATLFGDDIALRLSYAPLGQLAGILLGTGAAANAAGDLINALTQGDVPDFCGATAGHA
ncbi:hypothetical protein [Brevundimonas sp.]|uniref:hypothetical protein n=1 Tax=Brevundimonas sp. TaxID=1871086 RepID=UPI002C0D0952|nr:hypothetical protein [Brevundimonas sp.]HWQ85749.1 hypothetical protein [Brevundimonas sp.]